MATKDKNSPDTKDIAPTETRRADVTRRALVIGGAAATGTAAVFGLPVPFLKNLAPGVTLVAHAQEAEPLMAEKKGLTVLGDRPVNMEVPPHLLDDDVTPGNRLFVRNNGQVPDVSGADDSWELTIDGEVNEALTLTIADLKNDFEQVDLQMTLECGGNGRRFYEPGASGNQWTFGAVGCPVWNGVRLADVLNRAGLKDTAVYTAHYGADPHLSGDPEKDAISRGVPIEKALEPESMIVWGMNGENLPILNGHPLRLVMSGWPGSVSQKWLKRIWVRDQVHDGAKMTGTSYRVPAYPVAPGTEVPKDDMVIITDMPVKSLITTPKTGVTVAPGESFQVRGHAWAGDQEVSAMHVSTDFGATWQEAELDAPVNKFAWQHWRTSISVPEAGYYEVWARATDSNGVAQPPVTPGWNPKGYLNNMQHRVAVFAV